MTSPTFWQDIKRFREQSGYGLREARDAIMRYGSYDAAADALLKTASHTVAVHDPYAAAVADRERWQNKAAAYKIGLLRLRELSDFTSLPDHVKRVVEESLAQGNKL